VAINRFLLLVEYSLLFWRHLLFLLSKWDFPYFLIVTYLFKILVYYKWFFFKFCQFNFLVSTILTCSDTIIEEKMGGGTISVPDRNKFGATPIVYTITYMFQNASSWNFQLIKLIDHFTLWLNMSNNLSNFTLCSPNVEPYVL